MADSDARDEAGLDTGGPVVESARANHERARSGVRFPVRVCAVAFSIVTVLITAAAIHVPWEITARQDVRELVQRLNGEVVAGVHQELDAMLTEGDAILRMVRHLGEEGAIDFAEPKAVTDAFFPILTSFGHFSRISYARPDGDLYDVERHPDGSYSRVVSRWDPDAGRSRRTTTEYRMRGDRLVAGATRRATDAYYAPERGWYRKAITKPGEPIWSDVYMLSATGERGLRTAVALQDEDGGLHGVVSVAIELERISDYLSEVEARHAAETIVFDRSGRVLAATDPALLADKVGARGSLNLPQLADSWHPVLRATQSALEAGGVDIARLQDTRLLRTRNPSGEATFVSIEPLAFQGWLAAAVVPERVFTADIEAHRVKLLIVLAVGLLLVSAIAVWVMRRMFVRPLAELTGQTARLADLDFQSVNPPFSRIKEIDELSGSVRHMAGNLRAFGRYLPIQVVRALHAQGIAAEVGGERRILSILFMDIMGFTSDTERMGHRIVPVLTEYADAVSEEIAAAGGTLDKYIGDAVMAFWGAPYRSEEHAADACRAALDCLERLERLNAEHAGEPGWPTIRVRIGLNTGRVVVGNIGSRQLLDYTVIGDPVNLASRLEGLAGHYGVSVLIGQATYEQAKYDIVARRLDSVAVKGREERVAVYELLDLADPDRGWPQGYGWVETYERGLYCAMDGDEAGALACFREVIEVRGGDRPSELMIERLEHARASVEVPRLSHRRE